MIDVTLGRCEIIEVDRRAVISLPEYTGIRCTATIYTTALSRFAE